MSLQLADYPTSDASAIDLLPLLDTGPTIAADGFVTLSGSFPADTPDALIQRLGASRARVTVSRVTQLPAVQKPQYDLRVEAAVSWGQMLYQLTNPDPGVDLWYIGDGWFDVTVDPPATPIHTERESPALILLHMLSHAYDIVTMGVPGFPFSILETRALQRENLYRISHGMRLRLDTKVRAASPTYNLGGCGF